jgi:lipopolysaccharide transport system ATP-binding protein
MTESIISIQNLSKCYQIGRQAAKGDGLRHLLEEAVRAPIGWLRRGARANRAKTEEFWAVRDLSLEIKRGEMVGIIGRNGAGKSTLLKMLSRITEPTTGTIKLRGRVASLLEVGTGFHPELTGRENIFLNGAILGMSRLEIKRKFDEIVAFAEINKFLDTPVKRYSSGMYVRLAFAVAAHLEPEILIVDEVLAVGDAEFQKKCLGKMEDVSTKEGRTVILVSHQMPAIQNLCQRCILMDRGTLIRDGKTPEVISAYLAKGQELAAGSLDQRTDREGKGRATVTGVEMLDADGNPIMEAVSGSEVVLRISYAVKGGETLTKCLMTVDLGSNLRWFFGLSTRLSSRHQLDLSGDGHIDFLVPSWPLLAGQYGLSVYLESNGEVQDVIEDAALIETVDGDFFGTGSPHHASWYGHYVLVPHSWRQQGPGKKLLTETTLTR